MIKNSHLIYYQYNPYNQQFTEEKYDTEKMQKIRLSEVDKARDAKFFGIILGTLGRQGSTTILEELENLFEKRNRDFFVVLMSEISLDKLKRFEDVDAWVQIACPRLSIDWGHFSEKPLLNTYEAFLCLNEVEWRGTYPMDYYSDEGGPWANYFRKNQARKQKKKVNIKYE